MVDLLRVALGTSLNYTRHYVEGNPNSGYTTLENTPEVNAQKCHDFDEKCPINPEYVHIVQTREFAPAAVSRWLLDQTRLEIFKKEDPETFLAWMNQVAGYYKRWTAKWIDGPVPNRVIIRYEDFNRCPVEALEVVLGAMTNLSPERIKMKAIQACLIRPPYWKTQLCHTPAPVRPFDESIDPIPFAATLAT